MLEQANNKGSRTDLLLQGNAGSLLYQYTLRCYGGGEKIGQAF
jgi:hypothetical protein